MILPFCLLVVSGATAGAWAATAAKQYPNASKIRAQRAISTVFTINKYIEDIILELDIK